MRLSVPTLEKFSKDARKPEFTQESAMYILSLTVQDPDSLPEVELREKPLPFKPSGNGFGGKS